MQKEGKLKDLVNVMKNLLLSLGLFFFFLLFFSPRAAWISTLWVEASLGTYWILEEKGVWKENGGKQMCQSGGKMQFLSERSWQCKEECLLRLPLHKDALFFFISLMLLKSRAGLYKPRLEQIRKWSSELFIRWGSMWLGLLDVTMASNGAAYPLGFMSKSICSSYAFFLIVEELLWCFILFTKRPLL